MEHVDEAAAQAHPAPSEAQKKAGNYRKGHVTLHGLPISIENMRGSKRYGVGDDGKPWSSTMPDHYGYFKGTVGKDKDQVDTYIGRHADPEAGVHIIDQVNPDNGKFDEHKVMMGYENGGAAVRAYNGAFSDGRGLERIGAISHVPLDKFKDWLSSGNTKKAYAYAEGGTVDDDDEEGAQPVADTEPPSWDNMSAQKPVSDGGGAPSWDDLSTSPPNWDDLSATPPSKKKSGLAGAIARRAPRAVAAGIGSLPAMMAGAEIGAAGGSFAGPIGTVVGGFAGGAAGAMGAGYAISKGYDWVADKLGLHDAEQERADTEQHPIATTATDIIGGLAGMSPAKGVATIGQRLLGAGAVGGLEAGLEGATEGKLSPGRIAASMAAGAVFPQVSQFGERIGRLGTRFVPKGVRDRAHAGNEAQADIDRRLQAIDDMEAPAGQTPPGRPDVKQTPESQEAKAQAAQSVPARNSVGVAEAPPPPVEQPTAGNPQSAPVRSERKYPKGEAEPSVEATTGEGAADNAAPAQATPQAARDTIEAKDIPADQQAALAEAFGVDLSKVAAAAKDLGQISKTQGPPEAAGPPAAPIPTRPLRPKSKLAGLDAEQPVPVKPVEEPTAAVKPPERAAPERIEPEPESAPEPTRTNEDRALQIAHEQNMPEVVKALTDPQADPEAVAQIAAKTIRMSNKRGEAPRIDALENSPTARSEVDARNKSRSVAAADDAFKMFTAHEGPVPTKIEDRKEFQARMQSIVAHATEANFGVDPLRYKPKVQTPAQMWLREAAKLAGAKRTPSVKQVTDFLAKEKDLRSGDKALVDETRNANRIEADIALNKNTGDDAVASAESAALKPGSSVEDAVTPSHEDEVLERVFGRGRELKGDIPHEEAESMVEPVPVTARQYLASERKNNPRAVEAAELQHAMDRKAPQEESEVAKIKLAKDEQGRDRGFATFERALAADQGKRIPVTPELQAKYLAFFKDQSGSLNIAKIGAFFKRNAGHSQTDEYVASQAERLNVIRQERVNDDIQFLQTAHATPKEFTAPGVQRSLYRAVEEVSAGLRSDISHLPKRLQRYYEKTLKPMAAEIDKLTANINKLDPDILKSKAHIRRIALHDGTPYRPADVNDPVVGAVNSLKTTASALEDRVFLSLQNEQGTRAVISPEEDGFRIWNKGTSTKINAPAVGFKAGEEFTLGGQTYKITEALAREISTNARFSNGKMATYMENGLMSHIEALRQLRQVARHLQYLEELKSDPRFRRLATQDPKLARERGWDQTRMPQFRQAHQPWFMEPRLREVFDDYAKPGVLDVGLDKLRSFSQAVTKTMFWVPVPHIGNVGAHWFVGRGWQWIKPEGYRSLVVDGMQAIRSVITQDALANDVRSHGAGTVLGGILTQDFLRNAARAAGEDIKRTPAAWDPIAKAFGVGPSTLAEMLYRGSAKTMWAVNDMFLIQSILEQKRAGMTTQEAIAHTERHVPNYRVPTRVGSKGEWGRTMSKFFQDPLFVAFGRYHYGVYKSFAVMTKDLVHGSSEERYEALGNLAAMGLLAFMVKPALDAMGRTVTGNKDAEAYPRGPLAPLTHGARALGLGSHPENINSALRGSLTVSPWLSTFLEQLGNQDFAGRTIVQPGDTSAIVPRSLSGRDLHASALAAGRVAIQAGVHAARGLVSPIGTLESSMHGDKGPLQGFADTLTDTRNPGRKSAMFEKKSKVKAVTDSMKNFKQPHSATEKAFNRTFGYR